MAQQKARPFTPAEERIGKVVIRWMSHANTWIYRLSGGRLGGRWLRGAPVMLLTTIGRRSHEPRTTPHPRPKRTPTKLELLDPWTGEDLTEQVALAVATRPRLEFDRADPWDPSISHPAGPPREATR